MTPAIVKTKIEKPNSQKRCFWDWANDRFEKFREWLEAGFKGPAKRLQIESGATKWSLDRTLLNLAPGVDFTLRDAFQHVAIIGAPGSGKTSGSGRALAKAYLRADFGGIVFCVKPGEYLLWLELARACGRESDLIRVCPDGDVRIDLLSCNKDSRAANETENTLKQIKVAYELGEEAGKQFGNDRYWETLRDMVFRSAIHLSRLVMGAVTFDALRKICISAPRSLEQSSSLEFRKRSFCLALIDSINEEDLSESDRQEFAVTRDTLESMLATLGEKTRGVVDSMVMGLLDKFSRGALHRVFASGVTTHALSLMRDGRIFVIDFPVRETLDAGLLANGLMKFQAQREIEKEIAGPETRPVFLWSDDYPVIGASEADESYLSTARSSRSSFVMLLQNKPQLSARFGDSGNRDKADSLLANAGTVFFHSNLCAVTNQWASEIVGKTLQSFFGGSMDLGNVDVFGLLSGLGQRPNGQTSYSEHFEYLLQPGVFSGLATGGERHQRKVSAIMIQGGRRFGKERLPYLKVDFQQDR